MKIMVIDTATEACSVALDIDGLEANEFEVCPQQHSQRLLPMIDSLLSNQGVNVSELDFLAFGQGPGSFTGVRIATGMIQGLSLGTGLNVVGVSTLAAMAQQAIMQQNAQKVAVAIDARMSEVYMAIFENQDGLATLIDEEQVIAPDKAADLISEANIDCFAGTGWQAYPELQRCLTASKQIEILYPSALYMLPLARHSIDSGLAVDAENINPVYLRDKVTWKKLPGR